jgi:LemA protein
MRLPVRLSLLVLIAMMVSLLSGCGYNQIQSDDEAVKAAWAEVLNHYKRRSDLVPNLVNVVKGYAEHEKDVLVRVTEARSRVGGLNMTPEMLDDPQAVEKFGKAQGELSSALSRLLVVTENYPNLKADAGFRDLQAQLEGTENRVTVARNRFIAAVQTYNVNVRSFPANIMAMIFGYKVKPSFVVEDEKAISDAPKVDFGGGTSASPAK